MARTVNPAAVAARRNEILNVAHRLVLTKGYEQMSIKDILDEVQISSGAFHHYFDSRGALLQALIERIEQAVEHSLLCIVNDPSRSAIEKLQSFLATLDRLRSTHKADVVTLLRIWYSDDNAVVRVKVAEAVFEQRAPLLSGIVRQGVREGSFTTANPDTAGAVLMSLLQGMEHVHARLLLAFDRDHDDHGCIEGIISTHTAYMDAIERVLGAPSHSLGRLDAQAVDVWVAALRDSNTTS